MFVREYISLSLTHTHMHEHTTIHIHIQGKMLGREDTIANKQRKSKQNNLKPHFMPFAMHYIDSFTLHITTLLKSICSRNLS